jgi:hypothetical protein
MMGGDVTVTSEPGKGSVFTVRLPGGAETNMPWLASRSNGVSSPGLFKPTTVNAHGLTLFCD